MITITDVKHYEFDLHHQPTDPSAIYSVWSKDQDGNKREEFFSFKELQHLMKSLRVEKAPTDMVGHEILGQWVPFTEVNYPFLFSSTHHYGYPKVFKIENVTFKKDVYTVEVFGNPGASLHLSSDGMAILVKYFGVQGWKDVANKRFSSESSPWHPSLVGLLVLILNTFGDVVRPIDR